MKFDCILVIGGIQTKDRNISFFYNQLLKSFVQLEFDTLVLVGEFFYPPSKLLVSNTKSIGYNIPQILVINSYKQLTQLVPADNKILITGIGEKNVFNTLPLSVNTLIGNYSNLYLHPELLFDPTTPHTSVTEEDIANEYCIKTKMQEGYYKIIGMNMYKLPFTEINNGKFRERIFTQDTPSVELVWHRDRKNRYVMVSPEYYPTDWKFQLDNQPPINFPANKLFIPKETYHRLIKGTGDLKVRIWEND